MKTPIRKFFWKQAKTLLQNHSRNHYNHKTVWMNAPGLVPNFAGHLPGFLSSSPVSSSSSSYSKEHEMKRILTNGTVVLQDTETGETEKRILVVEQDGTIKALTEEEVAQRA